MRRALMALLAGSLTAPAGAVALRLFFAAQGVDAQPPDWNQPLGGVIPAMSNPALYEPSGRLYIWAQVVGGNGSIQYHVIGFNIAATGGAVIDDATIYGYHNTDRDIYRWETLMGGSLTPSLLDNVRLACAPGDAHFGVRDYNLLNADQHYDALTRSTLLGYIDVHGPWGGELRFQVGNLGILRAGATWGPVYFGFGDENDGPARAVGGNAGVPAGWCGTATRPMGGWAGRAPVVAIPTSVAREESRRDARNLRRRHDEVAPLPHSHLPTKEKGGRLRPPVRRSGSLRPYLTPDNVIEPPLPEYIPLAVSPDWDRVFPDQRLCAHWARGCLPPAAPRPVR
jgi:hypothetical protein